MKKIQINLVGIRQKHNKVKNENASVAGTDAAKTRRPF